MDIFQNLWSTRYLTTDPNGLPSVFFDVFTGLLALLLVASIYAYLRRRPLSRGVTPRRHLIRNAAKAGMWIAGIGLFLALMRYLQVQYLDIRILLYAFILSAIVYTGYLSFVLTERYPQAVQQFQQLEVKKRYRVAARRKAPVGATPVRSGTPRGKRRR